MNFSITPKGGGLCEICVEGQCHLEPCVNTFIEILNGRLAISFSKSLAEKIIDTSKNNGSLAFDHIDRDHLA